MNYLQLNNLNYVEAQWIHVQKSNPIIVITQSLTGIPITLKVTGTYLGFDFRFLTI